MYPAQQQYQYSHPQQAQPGQPQPAAPPLQQSQSQQAGTHQQPQHPGPLPPPQAGQGPYPPYGYPPPQQHPGPGPVPPVPSSYNPQYPPNPYPYPPASNPGYYYYPGQYPSPYGAVGGGPPGPYQSPYSSRPPSYPVPTSAIPPQFPPYPQPPVSNGYIHPGHPLPHAYPPRTVPGHATPPTKRQKVETSKASPSNSSTHSQSHRNLRSQAKEKKTFSDFRISKITTGNFTFEEEPLDPNVRDSRLRFYFRSGSSLAGSAHPSPRPHATSPQDDVAAQYPDRLSVSLIKGTRRIIIPATRLSAIYFNRGEGYVKIEGDGYATFEEIRTEEGHQDDAEAVTTSNKPGFSGPKFGPSEDDPTGGEWHRSKTMEIWLNTVHPLTEPKWSRGNLRDNIDPSSLFQNIIHIVDQSTVRLRPTSWEEMLESWRQGSMAVNVDARTEFIAELTTTEKIIQLLERIVQLSYPPLNHMVERLLALIKDKDSLHSEFQSIILGMNPETIWRSIDSIMFDAVHDHRETSQSAVSSITPSTKREREEDQDEEMHSTSNRDTSHHSGPPSEGGHGTSMHESTEGELGENVMDFGIPELSHNVDRYETL